MNEQLLRERAKHYLVCYYAPCQRREHCLRWLAGSYVPPTDLILDYRSNVALYPEFQQYLRTHQPPLLTVWGENAPSFIPAGAEAFRRDLPNAEIHFVPSGHFALESHHTEIARLMREFQNRVFK